MIVKIVIGIGALLLVLFVTFVIAMYKLAYYITEEFERR